VTGEIGTIYLIHFDHPVAHARHYLGWTSDLPERLRVHLAGQGSPLIRAASHGGAVRLVRTWVGTRSDERKMHSRHENPRMCPVCQGTPVVVGRKVVPG
jgi:predicted GIY-YIG superfamily endonuclease